MQSSSKRRGRFATSAVAFSVAAFSLGRAITAHGQAATSWTNPVSGNWTDSSKWTPASYPNGTIDAAIAAWGAPYTVTLTSSVAVRQLDIAGTGKLVVTSGTLTASTINLSSGGKLALDWDNVIGSTIVVGQNSGLSSEGSYLTSSIGTILGAGGSIVLGGSLVNYGNVLEANASTGSMILGNGGRLYGGTLRSRDGAIFDVSLGQGPSFTLDAVTLDAELAAGNSYQGLRIVNGLTMVSGSRITNDSEFDGTQTVSGSGELHGAWIKSGTITFGPGITVRGFIEDVSAYPSTVGVISHGTLVADGFTQIGFTSSSGTVTSDGTVVVDAGQSLSFVGNWSNSAGRVAVHDGTLQLGGKFKWTDLGTTDFIHPHLLINGTLNNAGTTLAANAQTGSITLMVNGVISGGTVATTDGARLLVANTGSLGSDKAPAFENVTVNGNVLGISTPLKTGPEPLDIRGDMTLTTGSKVDLSGGALRFNGSGGTIHGAGEIVVGSGSSLPSFGCSLPTTFESGITFSISPVTTTQFLGIIINQGKIQNNSANTHLELGGTILNLGTVASGGTGSLVRFGSQAGGSFTNQGTVSVDNGGQFEFRGDSDWTNSNGTIDVGSGTVLFAGTFKSSDIGTVRRHGGIGTIDLSGFVGNSAFVLQLDAATGSFDLISPGTISGGTIATSGGARLTVRQGSSGTAALAGVTIAGEAVFTGTSANASRITNGLVLEDGSISLVNSTTAVKVMVDGTISGNGTISFEGTNSGSASTNNLTPQSNGSFSISAGITLQTGARSGTLGLSSGTVISQGNVTARTLGQMINIVGNFSNQGVVDARNGGTVSLPSALMNFSAGTLTGGTWSIGDSSTITFGSSTITTNNANILLDGASSSFAAINPLRTNLGLFSITNGRNFSSVGSLTNTGTINIGSLSTLTVLDRLDNAAGLIDLNCKMIVDYSTVSPLSELVGQIGTHIISSAANADPNLGIGSKDDGNVVLLELTKLGDANLDGAVNYTDLVALSQNYSASSLVGPGWTGGDFNYDGSVNLTDLYALGYQYNDPLNPLPQALQTLGLPAIEVPEPGMMLLFAGMLGGTLRPRKRTAN